MKKIFFLLAFAFFLTPSVFGQNQAPPTPQKINIARQPILSITQAEIVGGQISVIVDSFNTQGVFVKKVARLINTSDFGVKANVIDNTVVAVNYNVASTGNSGLAGKIVQMTVGNVVSACIVDKQGKRIDFSTPVDLSPYLTVASAQSTYATQAALAATNTVVTTKANKTDVDTAKAAIRQEALYNINYVQSVSDTRDDSLKGAINAINTNVVRLLDVGTFYVATSGVQSLATMGDEFKPFPSPWAARDAAARKIKDGEISAATIVVKRGVYSFGLTATGATYTVPYAFKQKTFAIDSIPYYTSSPKSASLVSNNINYQFDDGATVTFLTAAYDLLYTTSPDTASIIVNGAGAWFKVLTVNQSNAGNNTYWNFANDSAQVSVIAENADIANSTGWDGGKANNFINMRLGRFYFNKSNGLSFGSKGQRYKSATSKQFCRISAKYWTDNSGSEFSGFVDAADQNSVGVLGFQGISGADIVGNFEKVKICIPAIWMRARGASDYNVYAIDSSKIDINIGELNIYRQAAKPAYVASMLQLIDTIVGSYVNVKIGKGVTEGAFINATGFSGAATKTTKTFFECTDCKMIENKVGNTTAVYGIDYNNFYSDTLSTFTIKGNYDFENGSTVNAIRIGGTGAVQIILDGTFNMRNASLPLLTINNPNARIILKSGSRLISTNATTITGVSGAKIYAQAGSEISGATTTATVVTTRPSTWNF